MKKISFLIISVLILVFSTSCVENHIAQNAILYPQDTYGQAADDVAPLGSDEAVRLSPREYKVTFLAVGDNIIYNGQLREALDKGKNKEDAEYDFSSMYSNVADIVASYDLAFVNQETPLAGKEFGYSQYPNFNSPQELGDDLIEVGFDIFNIATNHMLDVGS
ncbi:MAG: CapA family protein, partial [Clostridia bacterium]|nr:CapA family protein [Clostridia bacterium]